ncbi:MAG: sodium-dependent transporter [Muribaculaceae bacterium]|nr:sodium-dependent transporter [Muribaculaceae bacterium]
MASKIQFSSKIGLVAATVGSAIGLGNVWRFPAETQGNGGAAFLLLYMGCVLLLGIPVMLAEFAIGRAGRSDAIGSFRVLSPRRPWWVIGIFAVLASYLITIFYMVVEGWTLEYLVEGLIGGLYDGIPSDAAMSEALFDSKMVELTQTPFKPALYTALVILLNIGVLLGGVQKGIERLSNVLMPLLFVILVVLCAVSLSLPGAADGVRFFLEPDFSKLSPQVFVNALGQAFFSLSLGMGILITYASYYPASTKLPRTALIVSLLSLLVAVLMGLIIFPAVKTFGLDNNTLEGTTLVFVTLPEVFSRLPFPQLWSTLFFSLLLVAALTSTVSISEVAIATLQDRLKWSRRRSVLTGLLPLLVLSLVCSLSFSTLSDIVVAGYNIFGMLDNVTTNYMLPLVAIATCLYAGWFMPRGCLRDELCNYGSLRSHVTGITTLILRYVAPLLILMIFVYNFI